MSMGSPMSFPISKLLGSFEILLDSRFGISTRFDRSMGEFGKSISLFFQNFCGFIDLGVDTRIEFSGSTGSDIFL